MRPIAISFATASAALRSILGHESQVTIQHLRRFSSNPTTHSNTDLVKTTVFSDFTTLQAKVRSLLDGEASPLGSFQKFEFKIFKDFLRKVQKKKKISSNLIALEFEIMDRLVTELKEKANNSKSEAQLYSWICDSRFWLPTFEQWRDNTSDPTPADLWQRLQDWVRRLPAFRRVLVGSKSGSLLIILDTAVRRTNEITAAAQVAEEYLSKLLSWIRSEKCQNNHGVLLCNRVLEVLTQSGMEATAQTRIAHLLNDMRNSKSFAPDNQTYDIVLRYYSKNTSTDHAVRFIEDILLQLQRENLQPSLSNLVNAVFGFAKSGRIDRAENLLNLSKQKVESSSKGSIPRNRDLVWLLKGTRSILSAYAKQLSKAVKKQNINMIELLLDRACEHYRQSLTMCMALDESKQRGLQQPVAKLAASMMHCYACAQMPKKMEKVIAELMQRGYPMDASAYNRIIQPLGRHDRAVSFHL
jgi:pentatricopeptide repeat protein